jgi:hypothetical protein
MRLFSFFFEKLKYPGPGKKSGARSAPQVMKGEEEKGRGRKRKEGEGGRIIF